MSCPAAVDGLGAYVLGALEPEERARFEDHVGGCPSCAAELREFRSVAGLLARVRREDLRPAGPAPSTDLFDRLSAAAAPPAGARARTWALVAAAVLAVLAAGVGVVAARDGEPAERTVTAVAGEVRATVTATEDGEGSALLVGVEGMRPGETCEVVVVDSDGERYAAGTWPASAAGDGTWRARADVGRADLAAVVLLGDGGRELVRLTL